MKSKKKDKLMNQNGLEKIELKLRSVVIIMERKKKKLRKRGR